MKLKVAHFEKEINEIFGHVRNVMDSLPKINKQQESLSEYKTLYCFFISYWNFIAMLYLLSRSLKAFEAKQCKMVETCEMIQIYAGRIQKEAEGKWKMVQETGANRSELEKKLCTAEGMNYKKAIRVLCHGHLRNSYLVTFNEMSYMEIFSSTSSYGRRTG